MIAPTSAAAEPRYGPRDPHSCVLGTMLADRLSDFEAAVCLFARSKKGTTEAESDRITEPRVALRPMTELERSYSLAPRLPSVGPVAYGSSEEGDSVKAMKWRKHSGAGLMLAGIVVLATACTRHYAPLADAVAAATARAAVPQTHESWLVVTRPHSIYGCWLGLPVYLNKHLLGELGSDDFFRVPLVPGPNMVTFHSPKYGQPVRTLAITAEAGATTFIELTLLQYGDEEVVLGSRQVGDSLSSLLVGRSLLVANPLPEARQVVASPLPRPTTSRAALTSRPPGQPAPVEEPGAQAVSLDLNHWLGRPSVKLVAVEFYATWCKPCMAAIPDWTRLHESYRSKGLRLIVVSTRDPNAGCHALPWNPDDQICDYDGVMDQRFGVGGRLPAAFLWSWQGELLVRSGHYAEVQTAVEAYLKRSPRVLVETPQDSIRSLIEAELTRGGKLDVVVSDEDRALLRARRKATHDATRRDDQRCQLGQEVSPNSILAAKVFRAGKAGKRLSLSLQSLSTGCMASAVTVPWRADRPQAAVAEGVDALINKLRRAPQLPR